jgi:diadenosine tetraphosphatase ApaH/serine/threonine PP2A family protein phosphatase
MLALLYDIHGNLPALEAVLADAEGAGADRFLLGGDYALFGPFPAETVARLRQLGGAATWIRGNVDRWSAEPDSAPDDELLHAAISGCRDALGVSEAEQLARLDEQVVLDGVRYCHASPISDLRSFRPEAGEDDDELLGGVPEPRVVFGHTHLPFRRVRNDGVELINPGSVGAPFDGDTRAAYALVHDEGAVEHRRVAYDVEASAAALPERFGEAGWAQRSAQWLRDARRS